MSNPSWGQKRSATHRPYRSATSSSPMRRRIRPEASPSPNVGPQKFLRVFSGRIACIIRWWPGSWTTDPNGKQAFLLLFWFGRLLVIAKFGKRTYYEEFNKVRSSYKMMMKLLISFLTCLDCSLNANHYPFFCCFIHKSWCDDFVHVWIAHFVLFMYLPFTLCGRMTLFMDQ